MPLEVIPIPVSVSGAIVVAASFASSEVVNIFVPSPPQAPTISAKAQTLEILLILPNLFWVPEKLTTYFIST